MEAKAVDGVKYYKEKYGIKEDFNHVVVIEAPFDIDESKLPVPIRTDELVTNGYIVDIILDGHYHILLVNDYLYKDLLNSNKISLTIERG